jgi:hypothetical protein
MFITDIEFGSSAASGTAADSFPTLKYGTGTTCGTGTTIFWQALTAANTTYYASLNTPIKIPQGNDVCWIMTTAGSKTIQLHGFYGWRHQANDGSSPDKSPQPRHEMRALKRKPALAATVQPLTSLPTALRL